MLTFQKSADDLFKLELERKIHLPLNTPASPTDAKDGQDVSMTGIEDAKEEQEVSESDESPKAANRKLRHTNKNKRKRESDAVKKEKAKKKKAEDAKTKQQKEWEKLLNDIEKKKDELKSCEASIYELDDDLRETLVHRSKVIGKDRFLNKYYWFEHNGMPFGGVPNSSTAEYGYANGRLWVQGPDDMERLGYIDVSDEPRTNYFRSFQMTPAERKVLDADREDAERMSEEQSRVSNWP